MQHIEIERRLRRGRHRRETQHQEHISAHAVVLVHRLCIIHGPVQFGGVVLRDAHGGLDGEEEVGDEAKDGVRGLEVGARVGDFVVFDHDEASKEGEDGGAV